MIFIRHGQSEFNVIYGQTRQDPGIEDPAITELGAAQAKQAAGFLADMNVRRLISSPYRRALQTASIIAETLGLSIAVNPTVREHYAFSCDIGTPRDVLMREWPGIDFSHLEDRWWPHEDETDDLVAARGRAFIETSATLPDRDQVAVISHWGFIRGVTGLKVTNGTVLRVDPEGRGVVVGTPDP
ncbi:MAG: phosphoglycerate mutase family protein [Proteobacteria bacterium]|nr:phosphoglycerate mutase family protein [Pseudomonadota bacterium]MDA1308050.1 phosphoglycerate mutase family protein [Pseudomonadota bacterium]